MKTRATQISETIKTHFNARDIVEGGNDDIGWIEWTLLSPDGPRRYRRMWSRGYDGVIRQIQVCDPAPVHLPKWTAMVQEAQQKLWRAATEKAA
jgi:hypothetical protein